MKKTHAQRHGLRSLPVLACLLMLAAVLNAAAPPSQNEPAENATEDIQDVLYVGQPHPVMLRLHIRVDRKAAQTNWDDAMAKYFVFLDRNDSKTLDRNEITRAPSAQQMTEFFGGNMFFFARPVVRGKENTPAVNLAAFDEDRNGEVSLDEFKGYYTKNGAAPVVLPSPTNTGRMVPPALAGYNQSQSDVQSDVVFTLLDTDKDGKLSKKELEVAESVLMKFDGNDDEMIAALEIGIGSRNQRRIIAVQEAEAAAKLAAALQQLKGKDKQEPAPSNLILIPRDEGKRGTGRLAVAREMITRYDKDKDEKLTSEEVGFTKKMFESLDRNKDGKLTALELARWLADKPAGEFNVRLGDSRNMPRVIVSPNGAMMAPQNKLDEMSLTLDGVRINVVPQGTNFRIANENFLLQQYAAIDADKKGFITRKQVQDPNSQNAYLNNIFDLADRDGDGKLTEKELKASVQAMSGMRGVQVQLAINATGNGLFQILDANGDGRLSLRELRSVTKRLATLDKDGDSYLARSEFPQTFQLTVSQGQPTGQFLVDLGYAPEPAPRRAAGRGPVWFHRMDRNSDGDVSPAEWLGEKDEFDAIDADKDGLISAEEAIAYDAKTRK